MLKMLLIYISVIPLFFAPAAYGEINFIYPSPSSYVTTSGHFIFKINQTEITGLRITHNGLASEMIEVGSPEYRKLFQDFFIAQSLWDPGVNKIVIDLFNGAQKIDSAAMSIFYAPVHANMAVLPEYSPVTMHNPAKEILCQSCHIMNPSPGQMNSSLESKNPCFGCHKKMLSVKYVHGPAGTYSCGYCHSTQGKPKHVVPKSGSALCYECHSDMQTQISKNKFIHGPIEAGLCGACHDSHGSQNESQLLKPINELCISCHGHVATQSHILNIPKGGGHPLSAKQNPAQKGSGREMSCISCHDPHGGMVRNFFVNNNEDRMVLCQMCHNM